MTAALYYTALRDDGDIFLLLLQIEDTLKRSIIVPSFKEDLKLIVLSWPKGR